VEAALDEALDEQAAEQRQAAGVEVVAPLFEELAKRQSGRTSSQEADASDRRDV
jgi:hypothetical protein